MFIKRDQQGQIVAVSQTPIDGFTSSVCTDEQELHQFLKTNCPSNSLEESDADFIRVLDDLINLLVEQRVIQFTDLPMAAQRKLFARESLRKNVNDLNLIGSDNETIAL